MPLRLQCHERGFLQTSIRLLCPTPHAPLLAPDQWCQCFRQFGQITMMCYRCVVACHGATDPLLTWQRRPRTQSLTGPPPFSSKHNLIIEVVIDLSRIDCRCRGSYRLCCRLPVALRCRDAHPKCRFHFAAEFRHRRKHNNDFAGPAVAGITKGSADRPVVDAIENKAPVIVCEPHNELPPFVFSDADFFLCDAFDPEFLFSRQVLSFEEPGLIVCAC